ncbi:hypothetical protein ACR8GI_22170, partial [Salmonella enterica subsp. enterica serovar Paratyphi A]
GTLRTVIATADAIQKAANSGASQSATRRAAGVGSSTVFANSQNNQGVFDQVENAARSGRKLSQSTSGPSGTGTLRTVIATADAIQKAANSGASQSATQRAAGVGSATVFANSQNNQGVFDQVENAARSGRKLSQSTSGPSGTGTLRTVTATADAIQKAVNSGASQSATQRAAGVGSATVFANAQNNAGVFDQVEFASR